VLSHCWFATVQDVLQADWQEVWHSPQPLLAVFFNVGFAMVLMFFIDVTPRFTSYFTILPKIFLTLR
jgi:hypothetical protein